jgi:hypothetical protein
MIAEIGSTWYRRLLFFGAFLQFDDLFCATDHVESQDPQGQNDVEQSLPVPSTLNLGNF